MKKLAVLILFASWARAESAPAITPVMSTATFVEWEAPVVVSSVTLQEPPAMVHLPATIAKSDHWRGVQCAVTLPREALFRHADRWEKFWSEAMAPFSSKFTKVPVVDFNKDMVVAVFLGEKPTPHDEVDILSAKPEKDADGKTAFVVRYRAIHRMEGVFNPPFAIQPFDIKRVPRHPGPFRFVAVRY
jgi:hypothetical protein